MKGRVMIISTPQNPIHLLLEQGSQSVLAFNSGKDIQKQPLIRVAIPYGSIWPCSAEIGFSLFSIYVYFYQSFT